MNKIEQCLEAFEKLLIKNEEVDISKIEPELFKYTHPDVLFLGGGEPDCISMEAWLDACESQGEVLFSILTSLAQGEDVYLSYAPEYNRFFKVLDCAYGILFQAGADCHNGEDIFPIGLLEIMFDNEGVEIRDQEDLVGGTLLNGVSNLLLHMVDKGDAKGVELLALLDDVASFFLPLNNVAKTWYEYEEGTDEVSGAWETESCVNYDLGFGGQLGWYRLSKLIGKEYAFPLLFGEGIEEQAQAFLEGQLAKMERLKTVSSSVLTSTAGDLFNRLLDSYKSDYGIS